MRGTDEHSQRLRPVSLYQDELKQLAKIASAGSVEYRCDGFVSESWTICSREQPFRFGRL